MRAPRARMPIACKKKNEKRKKNTPRNARGFRSPLQRAPFFASLSPFSFYLSLFHPSFFCSSPHRAGNSRGWRRNIFPWTWVRADMWNEARSDRWKLFNDRQNDRSHLDQDRLVEKSDCVYISHFLPFRANNQPVCKTVYFVIFKPTFDKFLMSLSITKTLIADCWLCDYWEQFQIDCCSIWYYNETTIKQNISSFIKIFSFFSLPI